MAKPFPTRAPAVGAGLWPAAIAFLLLVTVSGALFLAVAWIAGTPPGAWLDPALWRARLAAPAAADTLGSAAEVVAGVLAVAVTVVAIVVELAAHRYTHHITPLFVRAPVNAGVMGFFVVTAVECLWVGSLVPGEGPGARAGLALTLGMATASLLLLLPYFAYVFHFLSPVQVVERLRSRAFRTLRSAAGARRGRDPRADSIAAVEQLADVARSAMRSRDREIAMAAIDALAALLAELDPEEAPAPGWYAVDGAVRRDPDFVALDPSAVAALERDRTWLDAKVLRGFHSLFVEGLGDSRDVCQHIAAVTRALAEDALEDGHPARVTLALRFFNSYLRAAVNARDPRTAYYVLDQLRSAAERLLAAGHEEEVRGLAEHMRFYGLLAAGTSQPFLLEVVAYDLALLVERAAQGREALVDPILDVLLRVDREEGEAAEPTLRGVRRAQAQLGTFFLARGDDERAARIVADMKTENPARLAAVREELLAEQPEQYFEFTDRGVNFAHLPPERRARVDELFARLGIGPDAPASRAGR